MSLLEEAKAATKKKLEEDKDAKETARAKLRKENLAWAADRVQEAKTDIPEKIMDAAKNGFKSIDYHCYMLRGRPDWLTWADYITHVQDFVVGLGFTCGWHSDDGSGHHDIDMPDHGSGWFHIEWMK